MAHNEAFRNIQNVISIFHASTNKGGETEMMAATRMTNFVKRASQALEAIHMSLLRTNSFQAAGFEEAMMKIQLRLEEAINETRLKSKRSLPLVVSTNE